MRNQYGGLSLTRCWYTYSVCVCFSQPVKGSVCSKEWRCGTKPCNSEDGRYIQPYNYMKYNIIMAVSYYCCYLCLAGAALTLKAATNALHSASHKWYKIGVQLEVSTHVLKSIEQQYRDPGSCLTDLLDHWMRNATDPHPSWRDLIDALGAPSVGEKKLAGELEEKHCNQKEPVTHKMKESSIPGSVEKREGMAYL